MRSIFFGPLTVYASFMFLPHATRVLASWLLGPKALFALIPAEVIVTFIFFNPLAKNVSAVTIVAPIVAASTAVVAFEFMKFMKIDVYPNVNSSPTGVELYLPTSSLRWLIQYMER